MRFEIQFQTKERSFMWGGGTLDATGVPTAVQAALNNFNYTFENVELVLDSVKLTDSIQRELNERAANDGLEIMFRTWWTSTYSGDSDEYNVEVRKAVSRAFGAIAHYGPVLDTKVKEAQTDVNKTHNYPFSEWQWRAGNLYFPHQVMRRTGYSDASRGKIQNTYDTTASNLGILVDFAPKDQGGNLKAGFNSPHTCGSAETFFHMQRLFGKNVEQNSENDMNQSLYLQQNSASYLWNGHSTSDASERATNYALIPLDLERTTVQDLSGIPLNNSRVLALNFRVQPSADLTYADYGTNTAGVVTIFLQHLKICRVFMDNTEIEE
jgi:hypothetical protein